MNCPNCNTTVDTGARFCRNCGSKLTFTPFTANSAMSQDAVYMLILLSWETISWLIWFVVSKVVVPMLEKDGGSGYTKIGKVYDMTGWTVDLISIIMLIVFSALTRNNTIRMLFIIFAVIRVVMLLFYRVFDK